MFRKMVCSMVVMVVAIGFVYADSFQATITKIEGDKVTIQKTKKVDKKVEKDGDPITLPLAKDAKVVYGTVKKGKAEVGDAVEGGVKAEVFTKAGDKGVSAYITTSDDNKSVTQILITKKKAK